MQTDKPAKNCENCIYKTKLGLTGELFCRYHGVVERSYICRRFSYDIFTNRHRKKRSIQAERFSPEHFKL